MGRQRVGHAPLGITEPYGGGYEGLWENVYLHFVSALWENPLHFVSADLCSSFAIENFYLYFKQFRPLWQLHTTDKYHFA